MLGYHLHFRWYKTTYWSLCSIIYFQIFTVSSLFLFPFTSNLCFSYFIHYLEGWDLTLWMYFSACNNFPFCFASKIFLAAASLLTVKFFTFRSTFKRSLSDGNILHESHSPMSAMNVKQEKISNSPLPDKWEGESNVLLESSPEISTCESDIAFSRFSCFTFVFLQ